MINIVGDAHFTKKGTTIFGTDVGPSAGTEVHTIRPENINK